MSNGCKASAKRPPVESALGTWVSPHQVSENLNVSYSSAWRICKSLPYVRVRGRIRVRESDVLAALRDGRI